MSINSKHRRVKSLVRGFEGSEDQQQLGTTTTTTTASIEQSNNYESVSPPTLHARTSSSSIQTLAAAFQGSSGSGSGRTASTRRSPSPSNNSSSRFNSGISNTEATMTSRRSNQSSNTSSNGFNGTSGSSTTSSSRYGYGNGNGNGNNNGMMTPLDTPSLESAEQDDEFLPMTSPFTPNYSLSGNGGPASGSGSGSPTAYRKDSIGNISPEAPIFATPAERREHSRRHSRVHERNLSVFFPRPEQAGLPGYVQRSAEDQQDDTLPQIDVPVAQTRGWGFANSQQKALGVQDGEHPSSTQPNTRRGHHHRHSMSHNFFPFLDGSPRRTSGNSNLSPQHARHQQHGLSPNTADNSPLSASQNMPKSVPAISPVTSSRHRHTLSDPSLIPSISALNSKYAHLPFPIRFSLAVTFHLPFFTQIVLLVSSLEIALGASLWITGQSGESLAVTGLGYLVVFDGLAAISSVLIEGNARGTEKLWSVISGRRAGDNAVRYPFGNSRINTLSHFAQCVYLIFSAVYVCKESIEHVLLLHGPDEMLGLVDADGVSTGGSDMAAHGAAHGGMGHGEIVGHSTGADWEDLGVMIPTHLLLFSAAACIFTALAAKNHASLTEAVGPSTYSLRPRISTSSSKSRFTTAIHNGILSNPFTLTVLVFATTLAMSSLLIPAQQLAPLDKVVALMESIAMFYVAYPAAVATGKVLLHTAPPGTETLEGDIGKLKRVIEEIENHPSVVYLSPPHIWQLNPHPPPVPVTITKPSSFGRKSLQSAPAARKEPMVTVITLDIQVKKESTDDEILRLTNWARERCLSAVAAPSGGGASSVGYSNGGGIDLKTSHGPGAGGARRVSSSLLPSSQTQQKQVELTVQVMRFEEERALQAEMRHAGHLHDHDHGHGHSHDTGHGHSHDHDAAMNSHTHAHEHEHEASHAIHMEPAHTHSHDAPSKSHGHHH